MAIKDIQVGQGNATITGVISEKGPVREFNKFDKVGRVCNAKLKDETGEIQLTLWNDEIDKVNQGDKVTITNGFVKEWQGEPQLSAGRNGTIEVNK